MPDAKPVSGQSAIPELDLPRAAYGSESLVRCWVPFATGDDYDQHFATEAEAVSTGYTARQLARPCISLWCAACGKPLGYDEDEHVHWASLDEAERQAEDLDWTTDGIRWQCVTCPPLERVRNSGVTDA